MKMLWRSGKFLAYDMVATLFFLALFSLTHNLMVSVAIGIAIGIVQIGWELARKKPVDAMQWLSVILVVASGVGALVAHDARVVLIKPAIIYAVVGCTMLKAGWMNRYLPEEALRWVPELGVRWGFVWAGLMFVSAALSLVLAFNVPFAKWVLYMSIWATGSKIAMFAVQFTSMRLIGRMRARRAGVSSEMIRAATA